MAAIDEQLKINALNAITLSSPITFWQDCRGAFRQGYMDVFQQVAQDPNIVPEQRIHKLHQDRHFRMEDALFKLAVKHGMPASTTLLAENGYPYVYVARNQIGFTESYVPYIGAMPKPAKFRERLAEATGIPRLGLGDEPADILGIRNFYGLLAHNPVGKNFDEQQQRLGMIQFCIPSMDTKEWVVELAIEEIITAYPQDRTQETIRREPQRREVKVAKKKEGI